MIRHRPGPLLRTALALALPFLTLTGVVGWLAWAPAPTSVALLPDDGAALRFTAPAQPHPDRDPATDALPTLTPRQPPIAHAPLPAPPQSLAPEPPALPPTLAQPAPAAEPTPPASTAAAAEPTPPAIRPPPRPPALAFRTQPGLALAGRLPAPPPRPAAVSQPFAAPPQLAAAGDCPAHLTRALPRRPAGAEGGRAAMARVAGLEGSTRDTALLRMLETGNMPDHLRRLVPVTLTGTVADGRRTAITLCVMPDYLALGHDRDFVRLPLGLPAASRIAERFDMILPTAQMVDAIHAQAAARLAPAPMPPTAQMTSTDYILRHNATIERQRGARPQGVLVSGHKKDLVLTNRLARNPGRVAIYGWHRADGQPIQPLSTVHGQHYADYSHGVRLISTTAFVNGRPADLRDLLADRRYAGILAGDEGPIATRQLLAALR